MSEERAPYSYGVPAARVPAVADPVVYVTKEGYERPAFITQVWDVDAGVVGLTVFLPKKDPATYVEQAALDTAGEPETWHWHQPRFQLLEEGVAG